MPGIDAPRDHRERALDVRPDRRLSRRGRRPRGWKNGTDSSRSRASSDARRYWASASSGQKTMSPCESPARMLRSRSKNMNHCGQSPSGFWARTRAAADRARLRRGRARAAARPDPGRRRACPSRRRSTARARAARGSGSARRARTTAGCPAVARSRRRHRPPGACAASSAAGHAVPESLSALALVGRAIAPRGRRAPRRR